MPSFAPPTELTASRIRGLATSLTEIAASLEAAADQVERLDESAIWVFGGPTAQRALKQLRAFLVQAQDSLDATHTGNPYTADSYKTHHGVKTPPPDAIEAKMVAEVQAEFERDINRSVAKYEAKKPSTRKKANG